MKQKFTIIAFGVLAFAGAAIASDAFIEDCEAFKSANGVDGDCPCMAEEAENAGVADEIMATETLADIDSLSDAAKAAIDACS